MNKNELISAVAAKGGLTKADATKAVNAIMETIQEELVKGGDVTLVGWGAFGVKKRPARTGRHPGTGEEINVPAANIPSFKGGKALKSAMNAFTLEP